MTPGRSSAMLAALVALVAAAGTAVAQPPSVTRHVLPNGMAVVVRENPVAPVVTASLQVRAGSRFETAETAGITNFLVRTMIRGTARRSGTQVAETAEDIGGSLDASGEVESGEIRGEALARHWEGLLGLIGGAAGRLSATLRRSAPHEAGAAPPAAPSGERRVLERPAQQAQILAGYLGPGLNDPVYPAFRVLGAVLGAGTAGRLFAELREKRGLAYSLGALTPFRTGPSFLITYLGTAPENSAAAEAGLLARLQKVRRVPVSDEELARAKAYLLGSFALDRRTNARQAWHLALFEVIGVGLDFPQRYSRALEAVTTAAFQAVVQRYLNRPSIVVLQPPPR